MLKGLRFIVIGFLLQGLIYGVSAQSKVDYSPYQAISIPKLSPEKPGRPVLVAVIDDAFRLSHKDFQGFIYRNPNDIEGNMIDDDGNQKVDDYQGWDIADHDNVVLPPEGHENSFFHGTFVASTILNVVKKCFDREATELVKILPVKVLSDFSTLPDYSMGYKGIEYAIEQKADIICCAWSGGEPTVEDRNIIQRAINNGILVIGSAGNAYSSSADPPGSLAGVLTVGGLDSMMQKLPESNYGPELDLSAPAQKVKAAYPLADNSYFLGNGTSAAAGLVAGCAAVLRIIQPDISLDRVKEALINTAIPIDKYNVRYAGRLGAGLPDLSAAASYIREEIGTNDYFLVDRSKGQINIEKSITKSDWVIAPFGTYNGFDFRIKDVERPSKKGHLRFFTLDSLWYENDLRNVPDNIYVPGNQVKIEYERSKLSRRSALKLEYESVPIDSSTIYCNDTRYYEIPEASFTDGSGDENYSNNSSCKWQITAPEGTRINIEFEEFKTQAKTDFVYLFDGESTIPDLLIAKFSGSSIPMSVNSRSNNVLVWFVTDGNTTDKGWKLSYRFEDN